MVLAVGVSLSLSRNTSRDNSRVKSTEDYWAESGLGASALEDLLEDNTCDSSERYFLACANAVLSVANRYNLAVNLNGELHSLEKMPSVEIASEKKQLEPWRDLFQNNIAKAEKISFFKVWEELKEKHIEKFQLPMMTGVGLNGFISVFRDPHTYLMPVAMFKEVISKADNRSTSLGIYLGRQNGNYVIRKVTEGSPAATAGLKKGDSLLQVNGTKVSSLLLARVTELLKGDVGDRTRLLVRRDGDYLRFALIRSEITVATVTTRILKGIKPVAVLTINKFAKEACLRTKEALETLNAADVRGLLLDLRDNPGGQMEEASCIASLFVGPQQKIFELRYLDPTKKNEEYYGSEEKIFTKPMAVLVNASSASASEIVAGALRDLNRAVLVGERTFGKGSFQEGELWTQNKKVALFETKGFYYLPSGRSPQMQGLDPDVKISFDEILVGREEDQFTNPLRAPELDHKKWTRLYNSSECLGMEESSGLEDQQLNKARQVLFCSKVVGANQ
jgi:carboxyl-terminal processing protease